MAESYDAEFADAGGYRPRPRVPAHTDDDGPRCQDCGHMRDADCGCTCCTDPMPADVRQDFRDSLAACDRAAKVVWPDGV